VRCGLHGNWIPGVTHASTARNTTHGPPAGAQRRVSANRQIAIDPETAFALLSDLDNHWRLADRFVDVLRLRGPFGARHGGEIRIKGPLGVRRTARTTITATRLPVADHGHCTIRPQDHRPSELVAASQSGWPSSRARRRRALDRSAGSRLASDRRAALAGPPPRSSTEPTGMPTRYGGSRLAIIGPCRGPARRSCSLPSGLSCRRSRRCPHEGGES
jgi:hypothetical protein